MKKLIKNISIITMNEENKTIKEGYVIIDGNFISEVGEGEFTSNLENMEVIDGKNHVAMPGLVNGHTHAAMTLLRGYGEGLPLMKWLNEKIWPMEAKFREEHINIGTKLACIEMLRTGTTTFNDMYFMQEEVLKVSEEFGMRAVLGLPIIGEAWEEQLKAAEELSKQTLNYGNDLISSMLAPHSPYTLSKDSLKAVADKAKELKAGIHIHISETLDEINIIKSNYNKTPVEFLEEVGIFNNRTVGAHCIHLTDSDLDIFKKYNVNVVYNPQSNMKLASGTARIAEMLEKEINVSLGTDGTSSNNNLNMFEEMETGALLQKLHYKDATKLDSSSVLKMSTINGAKALGLSNVGRIQEGYKADIILLDLNKPWMNPIHDINSHIVFSANGSEVNYVFINGETIMEKGQFLKIDEEKIIYNCNNLIKTLV